MFWLKNTLFIALLALCSQCSQLADQVDSTPPPIQITEEEDDENFTDIEPVQKTDQAWIYQLDGMEIEAEPNSRISLHQGPDFTVHSFVLKGKDTVNVYGGFHPEIPSAFSYAFKNLPIKNEWKLKLLKEARENGNHLLRKKEGIVDVVHINDSTFYPVMDSTYFEIIIFDDKYLWISKPLDNKSGKTDVVVDFKANYEGFLYHLFGNTASAFESNRIIELARQIK